LGWEVTLALEAKSRGAAAAAAGSFDAAGADEEVVDPTEVRVEGQEEEEEEEERSAEGRGVCKPVVEGFAMAVRCGAVRIGREGSKGAGPPRGWGAADRSTREGERGEGRRGMVAEVAGLGQDGPFGPVIDYYLLSGPF
jgi:adenine-specific DNA methylase